MKKRLFFGAALSTGLLLTLSCLRSAMSVFALYHWGSYHKQLRKGALTS